MNKKILMAVVLMLGLVSLSIGATKSIIKATFDHHNDEIRICHATHSDHNPFNQIEVDKNGSVSGHAGNDHQDGEDIIPPFSYWSYETTGTTKSCVPGYSEYGNPDKCRRWNRNHWEYANKIITDVKEWVLKNFEGQNWNEEGQETYRHGCKPEHHGKDVCPNIEGKQERVPAGYHKDEEGMCVPNEVDPSPTPTPTPTITPEPTPTPTPDPNGGLKIQLRKTDMDCGKTGFELTYDIKDNGKGVKDVKVKFMYHNDTRETSTNDAGEAKASFPYLGQGQAVAQAQGFDGGDVYIESLTCPDKPSTDQGSVLGASTAQKGVVLGAYASTGTFEEVAFKAIEVLGYSLTGMGSLMMALKKRQ